MGVFDWIKIIAVL